MVSKAGINEVIRRKLFGIQGEAAWDVIYHPVLGANVVMTGVPGTLLNFENPPTSFGLWLLRHNWSGVLNIEIGDQRQEVDLYSEKQDLSFVHYFDNLDAGANIRITVSERRNPAALGNQVWILGVVTDRIPYNAQAILYDSPPDDMLGREAVDKLLLEFKFQSVLDVGAGRGDHSRIFVQCGKTVSAIIGYGDELDASLREKVSFVYGDYLTHKFPGKFDLIWASHILEHQRNIGAFLEKVWGDLNDDGILALTVPPLEFVAGGGHVNFFSEGYLIYHCLTNGFDLSDVRIKKYGYNLSLICRKHNSFSFSNSWAPMIQEMFDRLPEYIVERVKAYMKENRGHERIPYTMDYKW